MNKKYPKSVNLNICKLIKKFKNLEENSHAFKKNERYIWRVINSNKDYCVSRHEIKRRIEDLIEHISVINYQQHSEYLRDLYIQTANHPLCVKNKQPEVFWAILGFLLELSYNPVNVLRTQSKVLFPNNVVIDKSLPAVTENPENNNKTNIDIYEESDLSDWSDSIGNHEEVSVIETNKSIEKLKDKNLSPNILPPKRKEPWTIFNPKKNLLEDIQNSWWLD